MVNNNHEDNNNNGLIRTQNLFANIFNGVS